MLLLLISCWVSVIYNNYYWLYSVQSLTMVKLNLVWKNFAARHIIFNNIIIPQNKMVQSQSQIYTTWACDLFVIKSNYSLCHHQRVVPLYIHFIWVIHFIFPSNWFLTLKITLWPSLLEIKRLLGDKDWMKIKSSV